MKKVIYNTIFPFAIFIIFISIFIFDNRICFCAASSPTPAIETNIDSTIIRVGFPISDLVRTIRLQSIKGEWTFKLHPIPPATGSETLFSQEIIEKIPEGEDITFQITANGITGRTSKGTELHIKSVYTPDIETRESEKGFSKIEAEGGELITLEIPNHSPLILSGRLEINLVEKTFSLINSVPMKELITSCVSDNSQSPEPEALKAAIIAARTRIVFLKHSSKHASESYDLCNTNHCLPFSGKGVTRELTTLLVDKVPNEILTHKGQPFFAYFHCTCGGKISSAKDIYNVDDQIHLAKEDRIESHGSENCYHSPSFYWVREFTLEEIADFLSVTFAGGAERVYLRWEPIKVDPVGRITEIKLRGKREKELSGITFLEGIQEYFGNNSVKSMRFIIEHMRRTVIFRGNGRGNGVGMCLTGADGMAKKGFDYKKILNFYYSNVEIKKMGNEKSALPKKK